MKKHVKILLTFVIALCSLVVKVQARNTSAEKLPYIPIVEFSAIDSLMNSQNDTIYVLNFWATWCKSCIEELPYFEEARKVFAKKNVKIILVSLDFANKLETVRKFVAQKGYKAEVLLMRQRNPDEWINRVHPEWSGAIPATLTFRNGAILSFHEGELAKTEVQEIIQQALEKTNNKAIQKN